jgi:5-methylcytosine-specific restriction endonuclease McrA
VTTDNVLRLIEWQHYRCALTGRALTPETASLDHIVPVRSGGEHRIENTQVLHRDVNWAKTTMTTDEFVQLCREVVAQASKPNFGEVPHALL